jgi:hypothetical protein
MASPNSTGKTFEKQCVELVEQHRVFVSTTARCQCSEDKYYLPDAITDSEVLEFKYQQVSGSTCNKLTQAIFELELMAEKFDLKAILVYEGRELVRFVSEDPAFIRAQSFCPNVKLMSFSEFNDYLTQSSDCNNRNENRLLEYAS